MRKSNYIFLFIILSSYTGYSIASGGLTEPFDTLISERCIQTTAVANNLYDKLGLLSRCKKKHTQLHKEKQPSFATHTTKEFMNLTFNKKNERTPDKEITEVINGYCINAMKVTLLIYIGKDSEKKTKEEMMDIIEVSGNSDDIVASLEKIFANASFDLAYNQGVPADKAIEEIQSNCENIYKSLFGY